MCLDVKAPEPYNFFQISHAWRPKVFNTGTEADIEGTVEFELLYLVQCGAWMQQVEDYEATVLRKRG